jgi:hypothetical protein
MFFRRRSCKELDHFGGAGATKRCVSGFGSHVQYMQMSKYLQAYGIAVSKSVTLFNPNNVEETNL